MIGKLKGLIDSYGEDYVILDVHGVGYQVHCSARTLQALHFGVFVGQRTRARQRRHERGAAWRPPARRSGGDLGSAGGDRELRHGHRG